ncbi:MAG: diadenylate cyclase [Pseudomonadota bacterium]
MQIFTDLRWIDFFDILILSFFLYRLFMIFWRTNAIHIILGLIFIWVVSMVAQNLGLVFTSWFMGGFSAVSVVIIIVIFRNEIRDVLIRSNPLKLLFGHPGQAIVTDYQSIADTVFRLARKKTGALIVFRRRNRLHDHLKEGIDIDALVSPQVIESVFNHYAPVHDGAMVIDGNRITKVGTYLPLTEREHLPQRFGTRHRAALGIAERSDAVVVVISEERQEVSIAIGQEITRIPSANILARKVKMILQNGGHEAKPNIYRLQQIGRELIGLGVSFIIVMAFWHTFAGKQQSLISLTAPLEFRNLPAEYDMIKVSSDKIDVQVSGNRRLINTLRGEQLSAFVDLINAQSGRNKIPLSKENLRLPPGLEVVKVTPSTIFVSLEQRIEKVIPVKVQVVGKSHPEFRVDKITVEPETIKVIAPYSVAKGVTVLSTEPVSIENLKQTTKIEAGVVFSPASIKPVAESDRKVLVRIAISPSEEKNKSEKK